MGQNIVQFYRKSHKLHFSNGIIFTTTQGKKEIKYNIFNFTQNRFKNKIKIKRKNGDIDVLIKNGIHLNGVLDKNSVGGVMGNILLKYI